MVPGSVDGGGLALEREAMGRRYHHGALDSNVTTDFRANGFSPGHAWTARREILDQVGFYDAMILGSGDAVMGLAAVGRGPLAAEQFLMNARQREHYLAWAKRHYELVGGNISALEGAIFHLWHGDLDDRGYGSRYQHLRAHDFDPYADIKIAENGCWRWSSDKPELHRYVREYFDSRNEDG